ncbi:DUF6319 family protein [Nocardia harenae]|uniref:DUF6319 family protein n=1 Tax=Nocardia harenae TaxID=358707 RepID=UPI00082E9268|nr:DUF6319 family protein [Nocardia harenae]
MPSPRNRPKPLSDSEIQQIAAEIAAGRPPMVWFTAAAVGVPEGRSGKVLSLGDPSDGDFLQVKPTGSKDVLSFSPVEVTLVKPARPARVAPAKAPAASGAAGPGSTSGAAASGSAPGAAGSGSAPGAAGSGSASGAGAVGSRAGTAGSAASGAAPPRSAPAPAGGAPANTVAPTPTPREDTPVTQPTTAPKPATPAAAAEPKPRPAKATARKAKTPEVTITLNGTAEGEWTVDVVSGKKRTVRGLAISTTAVSQAAKILHPEVEEVVAGILEAVRRDQQAKVAQLQAELEQARKLLTELGD